MNQTKQALAWARLKETYDGTPAPACSTYRAKVPGGWLVTVWAGLDASKKFHDVNLQVFGGGVAFVPDPTHTAWNVEEDQKP